MHNDIELAVLANMWAHWFGDLLIKDKDIEVKLHMSVLQSCTIISKQE